MWSSAPTDTLNVIHWEFDTRAGRVSGPHRFDVRDMLEIRGFAAAFLSVPAASTLSRVHID